jgi:hypothetical protein
MADKVRVVLNSAGVREMLLSNEMMAICKEAAQTIQGNYGKDTVLDEYRGKNRVNVSVVADYGEASENNDLLKAVHE